MKRSTAGSKSIAVIESALTRLSNDMNGKMDKLVAACQIGVNGNPRYKDFGSRNLGENILKPGSLRDYPDKVRKKDARMIH